MKTEAIKQFEGKHVTVVIKNAPRPTGGTLEIVGEDFVVLDPHSYKTERFVISSNDIVSILVFKDNQSTGEQENEIRREK